jgi:hypothetical protein
MYKLLLLTLMMAVWTMLHALQTDAEIAMRTLFAAKHAVNRAAHAAAQQLQTDALSQGEVRIDEDEAALKGRLYLQTNLGLDEANMPLDGSFLRDRVQLLVFDVINGDHAFPYVYRNDVFDYEVTLRKPGVIIIIRLNYPRVFTMLEPITWDIKGAAELVTQG